MKSHYPRIVKLVESSAAELLRSQCLEPGSRDYGGILPLDRGYCEAVQSAFAIDSLMSLSCCPVSSRYRDPLLTERALLFAEHLLREQHEDGTIDLRETNFHDATAVAFAVQVLAYTLRLLRGAEPQGDPARDRLVAMIDTFLRRGGEGMLTGGFHTPNHRWLMASALSLLNHLYGDGRFLREAELYLAEGIDCTEEGEYTERSVGIYNVVNNRGLIIMAEELGRPELLQHVRRNLDMVQRYVEPDGSLYTFGSRRQDLGQATYPTSYYENYVLQAHATGKAEYAGMAELVLAQTEQGKGTGDRIDRVLTQYLLRPELREREVVSKPPPDRYELWNKRSGLARLRSGAVSLGLLTGSGAFLKLQAGALPVIVRVAATFYGSRGPFVPRSIEREGEWLVLRSHDRWGYVRPFREPPPTSEWEAMPHEQREHANMQDYEVEARARFTGDGVTLRVSLRGVSGMLAKVELILPAGGWLETEDLRLPGSAGGWALLRGARATYARGHDRVEIRGGFAEHASTVAMRGSEPQDLRAFTLYCTGYTPMEREIEIRAAGGER